VFTLVGEVVGGSSSVSLVEAFFFASDPFVEKAVSDFAFPTWFVFFHGGELEVT
jgi:hypothetical protein